jgi:hypothetical protein
VTALLAKAGIEREPSSGRWIVPDAARKLRPPFRASFVWQRDEALHLALRIIAAQ